MLIIYIRDSKKFYYNNTVLSFKNEVDFIKMFWKHCSSVHNSLNTQYTY